MTVRRPANTPWWRGAVLYQIYPRSFFDTTGNGVGDLHGVAARLDYVADLGVDGVWLSPFFTSPMRDFGYDVADYCAIDPLFGDMPAFDRLIEKAHRLGLRVIIDQVYSHTSDQHDWFRKSRMDRVNPKADWYVWADAKPDGAPPNNWQSVFSGPAWTWDAGRRQYYLHNFLAAQPDLNLHNEQVQSALFDVARFWIARGVDGFRLDAINFAMHDPALRDNPPAPATDAAFRVPFDFQRHENNQSHEAIPVFLNKIRNLTKDREDFFTVAEVVGPTPLDEMKAFTADNQYLSSAYNFDFLYADRLSPALLAQTAMNWPGKPGEGWPSWAFSNHDAPRAVSRWAPVEKRDQAARLYLMILMVLRGNIFLYQGEELGLPQADIAFEDLRDPEAVANWPHILGRDGARTPMPWKASATGGFSSAKPWLPISPSHHLLGVDRQEEDADSILHFTRALIALRQTRQALRLGEATVLESTDSLFVLQRQYGDSRILGIFNLSTDELSYAAARNTRVLSATGYAPALTSPPPTLPPLSGYLAEMID